MVFDLIRLYDEKTIEISINFNFYFSENGIYDLFGVRNFPVIVFSHDLVNINALENTCEFEILSELMEFILIKTNFSGE